MWNNPRRCLPVKHYSKSLCIQSSLLVFQANDSAGSIVFQSSEATLKAHNKKHTDEHDRVSFFEQDDSDRFDLVKMGNSIITAG